LENSCYELLLILAQAAGKSPPTMPLEERHARATEGLRILTWASQLGPDSKALHQRRADLLEELGDEEGSDEEKRLADALPPSSASDFFLDGLDQLSAGDGEQASSSFNQVLRLQPNHFEAQFFLAYAGINAGRAGEARIGLTACLAQRPEFAWAYLFRGAALVQLEEFEEAESDFTSAAMFDTGETVRYAALANRGRLWLRQEKLEEALADFQAAARLEPNECQAHLQLALACEKSKRLADADREIDEALRLQPELPLIPRQRGRMRRDRKDLEGALADFRKAIQLELKGSKGPELADDYVHCGEIRHSQGRFAEALSDYDSALRLRPDHALAFHLRGESLLALERFGEAERAFGQNLDLDPDFGPALRGRGQARMQLGDYPGAIEDYTQAARLERDASILMHRGWAYFFSDSWRLAEHDFAEAMRIETEPGDARIGRGLARVMLGYYKEAVADARDVLDRSPPKAPEMMHNVACIFALAIGRARADAALGNRETLQVEYRRQAIHALGKTLEMVPAKERRVFWQKKMCPDTALDSIRSSPEFVELDVRLHREAEPVGSTLKNESGKP
jgi:tetratricopeptide (TPR) repeat protein